MKRFKARRTRGRSYVIVEVCETEPCDIYYLLNAPPKIQGKSCILAQDHHFSGVHKSKRIVNNIAKGDLIIVPPDYFSFA